MPVGANCRGEGIRFGMAVGGGSGGVLWGGSELDRGSRWGRMGVAGEWNNAVGEFRVRVPYCGREGTLLL